MRNVISQIKKKSTGQTQQQIKTVQEKKGL